jgi:ABC-type anion transport system duplicated permease subunit
MWTRIKPVLVPTHIGYLIGETDVATAMEASWKASFAADGIERHHALADARALRVGYLAMHGGAL